MSMERSGLLLSSISLNADVAGIARPIRIKIGTAVQMISTSRLS